MASNAADPEMAIEPLEDIKPTISTTDTIGQEPEPSCSTENDESPTKAKKTPKTYSCTICNYTNQNKYLFNRHIRTHSSEKTNKCPYCDRSFRDTILLNSHLRVHSGHKPFRCEACSVEFASKGELTRHNNYKHLQKKPHKCPQCDYASVEKSKLNRHIRTHTDERPYLCPHCDYASRDTFKLKRHLRTHTGEKPYECPVCQTHFTQSNSLKVHLERLHGVGGDMKSCAIKFVTCEHCGLKFKNDVDLKDHVKLKHTASNGDDTMPEKTGNASQMNSTESDWFLCTECNMMFATKDGFESHYVKHTGERPYVCHLCGCKFSVQFALRAHVLSHGQANSSQKLNLSIENERSDEDGRGNASDELMTSVNVEADCVEADESSVQQPEADRQSDIEIGISDRPTEDTSKTVEENVVRSDEPTNVPDTCEAKPTEEAKVELDDTTTPKILRSTKASKAKAAAAVAANNKEAMKSGEPLCTICWKTYCTQATLIRHLKTKHNIVYTDVHHNERKKQHGSFLAQLNETAISQNSFKSSSSSSSLASEAQTAVNEVAVSQLTAKKPDKAYVSEANEESPVTVEASVPLTTEVATVKPIPIVHVVEAEASTGEATSVITNDKAGDEAEQAATPLLSLVTKSTAADDAVAESGNVEIGTPQSVNFTVDAVNVAVTEQTVDEIRLNGIKTDNDRNSDEFNLEKAVLSKRIRLNEEGDNIGEMTAI